MAKALIDTPIGALTVIANDVGVCRVWFGDLDENASGTETADEHLAVALTQLSEYFDGVRTSFDVAIDRSARTGFAEKFWTLSKPCRSGKRLRTATWRSVLAGPRLRGP